MTEPGHNNPPDMAATAREVANDLNEWAKENPSIDGEYKAREAKVFIDRAKLCLKDLEDERDAKVRPLNEQVASINEGYRQPRTSLMGILNELQRRLSGFLRAEEARRAAIADQARQAAEEAERLAREAERLEQERLDDARRGELGVDLLGATEQADKAFEDFQKADRQAQIAAKDAKVKIGGGIQRAIGLRQKETLRVQSAFAAIAAIGMTPAIEAAILSAARAYRRLHNKLPPGVEATTEREL